MRLACPRCETVVEVLGDEAPVCPVCGFGAEAIDSAPPQEEADVLTVRCPRCATSVPNQGAQTRCFVCGFPDDEPAGMVATTQGAAADAYGSAPSEGPFVNGAAIRPYSGQTPAVKGSRRHSRRTSIVLVSVALVVLLLGGGLAAVLILSDDAEGDHGIYLQEPRENTVYRTAAGTELLVAKDQVLLYLLEPLEPSDREDLEAKLAEQDWEIVGEVPQVGLIQIEAPVDNIPLVLQALAREWPTIHVAPNFVLGEEGHVVGTPQPPLPEPIPLAEGEKPWQAMIGLDRLGKFDARCPGVTVHVVDRGTHGRNVTNIVRDTFKAVGANIRVQLSEVDLYITSIARAIGKIMVESGSATPIIQMSIGAPFSLRTNDADRSEIYNTWTRKTATHAVALDARQEFRKSLYRQVGFALRERDALFVVAAGNDGTKDSADVPPDWEENVIAVGSSWSQAGKDGRLGTADDPTERLYFSAHGPFVNIYAPGFYIYADGDPTWPDPAPGTSYSAPQVSAVAALVRCILPQAAAREVKSLLLRSAPSSIVDGEVLLRLSAMGAVFQAYQIKDGKIVTIDDRLHHIGDDQFMGSANSGLEIPSEGTSFELEFELERDSVQDGAMLRFRARGIERYSNAIHVNGVELPDFCCSPEGGGFGLVRLTIPPDVLEVGANVLTIESGFESGWLGSDYDDWEFIDLTLTFGDPADP